MKRRIPLLLLFLGLAALAFWLWKRDRGTTLAGPLADFAVADTAAVSRIFIAETTGKTVDLRRDGKGGWTVNGMPANRHPIELLLKTFVRVEVKSPVPKAAEANVLRVMSSTTKKVEIYQGGEKPAKTWFVGHATKDHYGTYMLLEIPGKGRSSVPFVMGMSGFTGFLSTRFHTKVDEFRSSVVFKYPDLSRVKALRVQHSDAPTSSFSIVSNEGRMELLDKASLPVPMDTASVRAALLQIRDLHFEYFERELAQVRRDSILATEPKHVITVTEVGGTERRIPLWRKPPFTGQKDLEFRPMNEDPDRLYALIDDTALVVVQRHLFDRILPPIERLRR